MLNNLNKGIAFNPSYRENWRDYLGELTSSDVEVRLTHLLSGMDAISEDTARYQLEMVRIAFPHPILNHLFIEDDLKERMLPKSVRKNLRRFGLLDDFTDAIAEMKAGLDLPEDPLPEFLTHSGLAFIRRTARPAIKKRTVIDAGAYIGDTARLFQKYYRAGRVFAIEPERANLERMNALVQHWDADGEIIPVHAATGNETGQIDIWGEGVGCSTIRKAGLSDEAATSVPVIRLDDLVAERRIRNVAMIKLDVEGAEYDTILGARHTIETQRPILLISIYHTAKDFFEIKPLLESWNLDYEFRIRKLTTDFMKEVVLIAQPKELVE